MMPSAYRDTRNLIEYVRALGYPRRISMDNFRAPNFELVAEVLYWLFQRYDPDLARDVPFNITAEQDRVAFLREITKTLAVKGQIAINPKRLYKADQTAVSELLKVAGFLYEAHLAAKPDAVNPRGAAPAPAPDFLSVVKEVDVKQFRKLASEITALGAKLSDGLQAEAETLREARAKAVQRAERLDVSQVEAAVRDALGETREKLEEVRRAVEELSAREQAQQGKLQKRLAEVRRAEERLETLQDVRPVYMDEYEKMEGELQALFGSFLERQRTLTFLESQLERHRAGEEAEAEAHRAALLQMQRRLRDEEMNELRGSARLDVDGFDGIPPPQQHAAAGNGVGGAGMEASANGGAGEERRRAPGADPESSDSDF